MAYDFAALGFYGASLFGFGEFTLKAKQFLRNLKYKKAKGIGRSCVRVEESAAWLVSSLTLTVLCPQVRGVPACGRRHECPNVGQNSG